MAADTVAGAPPTSNLSKLNQFSNQYNQSTLNNIQNSIITSYCINHINYTNPQFETLKP